MKSKQGEKLLAKAKDDRRTPHFEQRRTIALESASRELSVRETAVDEKYQLLLRKVSSKKKDALQAEQEAWRSRCDRIESLDEKIAFLDARIRQLSERVSDSKLHK